jgi:hypothetical protein
MRKIRPGVAGKNQPNRDAAQWLAGRPAGAAASGWRRREIH